MTPVLRICSQPGCGRPTTHPPHCTKHATLERDRRKHKTKQAGYTSAHWKRIRGLALNAAGYTCSRCGGTHDLTVHLNPVLHGNHRYATPTDCTVLCRSCHGSMDAPRAHA